MATLNKAAEEFIERIQKLDNGKLAMLRRGCGERDPVQGRCPWLLDLIHGATSEPTAFLVASLLAQYKTSDIQAGHHRIDGNFGATWKRSIAGNDSESIKRRFFVLLDAEYDPSNGEGDLPYRIRQMVRYSAGKGVGICWSALLMDLTFWNWPEKLAQKRWAQSFFSSERVEDVTPPQSEEE